MVPPAASDPAERGSRAGGRPRDPGLDGRIIAAAEQRLRAHGYAGMSIEAVAAAAGTSVPSVRRRYRDRAALAAAVIDAWRAEPLPGPRGSARRRALAVLENFRRNLALVDSMPLLGTLLAEEGRHPELIRRFRARLVKPRRAMLADAIEEGVREGELPRDTEVDCMVNMLIGSFYACYIARGAIPEDWAARVLGQVWPPAPRDACRTLTGYDTLPIPNVTWFGGRRMSSPLSPAGGVIRVSRATFDPGRFAEVERMLRDTATYLSPAIRGLDGLLGYYAGASPEGSVAAVSLWHSNAHADQMGTLKEMTVDARRDAQAVGVSAPDEPDGRHDHRRPGAC